MSQIGTTYSNSYSSGASYSAGIWQGTNAVFPSIPGGNLPGDRAPMPSAPPSGAPAPNKRPGFKLRKSIQPKQPLTILHELSGGAKPKFDFYDVPYEERERRAWQMDCSLDDVGCYECRCTVQGMEFIGEGLTKFAAKENVTEIAVQGLITSKCEMNEMEGGVGTNEDNTPWVQIASLALYKMYNDWQAQGFQLPNELTNVGPDGQGGGRGGSNNEPLGDDNNLGRRKMMTDQDKPALQLVNELASRMKLTLSYDLVGEVGTPNDRVFTFAVKIKDKTYSGQAKNKKTAKQSCAQAALADKDAWYSPPVVQPRPPGDGEDQEDNEGDESMAGDDSVPPSKRRAPMDPEMKKLYFGNDQEGVDPRAKPKIVFREPQDKGSQPGSHPSNI